MPGFIETPHVTFADVTARSSPVSAALRFQQSERTASFDATLRVIDSIYNDGSLNLIDVKVTARNDYQGLFTPPRRGDEANIAISRSQASNPELTLIHEIGHFIDFKALGHNRDYASKTDSMLIRGWKEAVLQTETVAKLKLAAAGKKIDGQWPPGNPGEYRRDYLPIHELWARSYTKYIVSRCSDASLREQYDLANARLRNLYFWPDTDFQRVDHEMTEILKSLQWLT